MSEASAKKVETWRELKTFVCVLECGHEQKAGPCVEPPTEIRCETCHPVTQEECMRAFAESLFRR